MKAVTIKHFQGILPRVDYIVGLGFGINVSLSRERCGSGGTIGERVRLGRGTPERFKTFVDFSIGTIQLKLQQEWQGF